MGYLESYDQEMRNARSAWNLAELHVICGWAAYYAAQALEAKEVSADEFRSMIRDMTKIIEQKTKAQTEWRHGF